MKIKRNSLLLVAIITVFLTGCSDQWDNHVKVEDKDLSGTLLNALKEREEFSVFYNIIIETGYRTLLEGENRLTVLAPGNEALSSYSLESEEAKMAVIKNHIAYLSYSAETLSGMNTLKMLNGKNLDLSLFTFSTARGNILCDNGIIHPVDVVVQPAFNILEYLETLSGSYPQADTLFLHTRKIMDMENSIPVGLTEEGLTRYDTVWVYPNHFLDQFDLGNEDENYEFVLLEEENLRTLKKKYHTYMLYPTEQQTDSVITDELIRDLVFLPGSQTAISGIEVDFSQSQLVDQYRASNGMVKTMKGVDIRIKDNKIKDIYIEGEDLTSSFDPGYIFIRSHLSWARGGKDVMLNSRYRQVRSWEDEEGNSASETYNFYGTSSTNLIPSAYNFYLEYKPRLYSNVDYDIYWVANDDLPDHAPADAIYPEQTVQLYQKLYVSLPHAEPLTRGDDSRIYNHYNDSLVFVGYSVAGTTPEEVKLKKYFFNKGVDRQYITDPYEGEGSEVLSAPFMGESTFYVCNTATSEANNAGYAGFIFLDYIRLVPRIEEE